MHAQLRHHEQWANRDIVAIQCRGLLQHFAPGRMRLRSDATMEVRSRTAKADVLALLLLEGVPILDWALQGRDHLSPQDQSVTM